MECETARLAISEAIDSGEPVAAPVEAHLAECAGCRRWQEAAHQLRRATMRPVAPEGPVDVAVTQLPERFAVEIEYGNHAQALRSSFYPGASPKSPHAIQFQSDDYFEVLRLISFVI